jgi:hypothetical protein
LLPVMVPIIFYTHISHPLRSRLCGQIDDETHIEDVKPKKPTPRSLCISEFKFSDGFGRSEGPESMFRVSAKVRSMQIFLVP